MSKGVFLAGVVSILIVVLSWHIAPSNVPAHNSHNHCSEKLNKLSGDIQRLDTMLKQLQQRYRREQDRKFATKYAAAKPHQPPINVLGIDSQRQEYRIR